MSVNRRLAENIAALSVVQFLNYVAPLITIPYLVRILHPAQFGLLSFSQGIVLCFCVITDYGFDFTATRAIAASRQDGASVRRIAWTTLCSKFLLLSASACVLALLVALVPKLRETPSSFAASFLYVLGTALFPVWLLQGLEELKVAALAMCIARMLVVPALFLFVQHAGDYVIAAALQASVEVIATLIAVPIMWRRVDLRWVAPTRTDLLQAFKTGWPLFLSASTLYLSASSTPLILGFVSTKAEVGYYSAAEKLIRACTALLSPATQALYPRITATKAQSTTLALKLIRRSFAFFGGISLCVSLLVFCFADPVCRLVLGSAFIPSIYLLKWMAPLPFLTALMSVLGTQTMLAFEMDAAMSRILLQGSSLAFPLTLFLAWKFGALGAAVATVVVAVFMAAAMANSVHRSGLGILPALSSPRP
jgi:O-antigen/teichoic acid export membrane protein